MQRLLTAVTATGARVVTEAVVQQLVVDRDGSVVGLQALIDGSAVTVRARRGVVLAAGGFTFNPSMVQRHCPEVSRVNVPIGTPFDDGRALRMAQGVGAATVGMGHIEVGIPLTPPRSLVRGILVNGSGRRFINEDTYAGRIGRESLLNQGGEMYFVHSDDTFEVNVVGYTPRWVAESAAELEEQIGLPPASLEATLDNYNRHAVRNEDPEHRKAAEWVVPLQAPYGVVDLSVEASFYASFTLGGLHTDTSSRVLDASGAPIPGLHAAGRTTAGIAGAGYVSGISLADGIFFGRRAGRAAAKWSA